MKEIINNMTEYENVREQYHFNSSRLMNLLEKRRLYDERLDYLDATTGISEEEKKKRRITILKALAELCNELQDISSSLKYASNRALFVLENDID